MSSPSTSRASYLPPYSPTQLRDALHSLLDGSINPTHDARHIYGYNNPHHDLSMLQIITATRILDYRRAPEENAEGGLAPTTVHAATVARRQKDREGEVLNLKTVVQATAPRMALAAEFKRASPSKGPLAPLDVSAGDQAVLYAQAGADIISVLTEPHWFQGNLDDLQQVRDRTSNLALPRPAILRKDFVISKRMIKEALEYGADTILLIVAILPLHLLKQLIDYARLLHMEPLVEVHTDLELEVAAEAGASVIGINNRNLHTFQLDLSTSERIAHHPLQSQHKFTSCALSGMSTADDVHRFRQVGIAMCLIGEALMRSTNPQAAIDSLHLDPTTIATTHSNDNDEDDDHRMNTILSSGATAAAVGTATAAAYIGGLQLVKVCGITTVDDAILACQAGANLIGIIFATKSPRRVEPEQAVTIIQAVRAFGERNQRLVLVSGSSSSSSSSSPLGHLAESARTLAQATRRRPAVVGVFQNQDPGWIRRMAHDCGLDLIQLHGSEGMAAANPDWYGGVPTIRVVDIEVDPTTGQASANAAQTILESLTNDPMAILLDTSIKGASSGGGTGRSFDWTIAQQLQNAGLPVLVAGGLTSESVGDCVSLRPFGVDVSSGVEKAQQPGIKDPDKVRAFVQAARQAEVNASKGF